MIGIRKLPTGRDYTFAWLAPEPVTGTPSLVLKLTGGNVSTSLTAVAAAATVASISDDGYTVTLRTPVGNSVEGIVGNGGHAWLDLASGATHGVSVAHASGNQVMLAAPLPSTCKGTTSTLRWALYTATIDSSDLGTVQRNVEWVVTYTHLEGADATSTPRSDFGLCHVVRAPFATGLTAHNVLHVLPSLRVIGLPRGQTDYRPQVDAALAQMIPSIEARLAQKRAGAVIDDVRGSAFQVLHARHVAIILLHDRALAGSFPQEAVDAEIERAEALLDTIMGGQIWIDTDDDGVADDGEISSSSSPSTTDGYFSDDDTFGDDGTFDRFGVEDDR